MPEALPASLSSTKRFMKEMRAVGVSCEKVCALRAVRNLAKSFWLCAHAADKASRSAALGEPAGSLRSDDSELAVPGSRCRFPCCAWRLVRAGAAQHRNPTMVKSSEWLRRLTFANFTLIPRGAQDCREVLCEFRARHHLAAP